MRAYGRAGDLVLVGAIGARVTIAAREDHSGHRPLRGAVLDVQTTGDDRADPLLWRRDSVVDSSRAFHGITASVVDGTRWLRNVAGVRIPARIFR